MPQMAPMNWLSLFIFFSFIFLLAILINYYFNLFSHETNLSIKNNQIKTQKYWKW
uniref:ATP synthase complex subunit 8 n=1 Tax=Ips grandicollis TaxID=102832 RepID=A0A343UJJ7_9CUCU|nr:ATP synthase F0 subunit 8 [Ips grandicollis]